MAIITAFTLALLLGVTCANGVGGAQEFTTGRVVSGSNLDEIIVLRYSAQQRADEASRIIAQFLGSPSLVPQTHEINSDAPPELGTMVPLSRPEQSRRLLQRPSTSTTSMSPTPACSIPALPDPKFSATQVAFLASSLQRWISPPCYTVIATSLAVCLPDLSLLSGCCTYECSKALRLAIPDTCTIELAQFACSNATQFADTLIRTSTRCVGSALSCEALPGALAEVRANLTQQNANLTLTDSFCPLELQPQWRDFNHTRLFDLLIVFAEEVTPECLRTAVTYVPICYQDLQVQSGCCSVACRAATLTIRPTCAAQFTSTICRRAPFFMKYYFALVQRCASITLKCTDGELQVSGSPDPLQPQVTQFNSTLSNGTLGGLTSRGPVIYQSDGSCSLDQEEWSPFNSLQVAAAILDTFSRASGECEKLVSLLTPCSSDLRFSKGCCSAACALALSQVSEECTKVLQYLMCTNEAITSYTMSINERCLGYRPSCLLVVQAMEANGSRFLQARRQTSANTGLTQSVGDVVPGNISLPSSPALQNTTNTLPGTPVSPGGGGGGVNGASCRNITTSGLLLVVLWMVCQSVLT